MCKVGVIQLRQGKAVLQHRSQIIRILLIVPEHAGEHYMSMQVSITHLQKSWQGSWWDPILPMLITESIPTDMQRSAHGLLFFSILKITLFDRCVIAIVS